MSNENSRNNGLGKKDYLFVGVQLILFILYFLEFNALTIKSQNIIGAVGLVIAVIGALTGIIALLQLKTNISPFPSPKANASLIKTGLYKFIRHPIYTGIILVTFGFALYVGSIYKIVISIGLYVLFFFKSNYEEERLTRSFPGYTNYQKRTGRFFPSKRRS